MNNKSCGCNKNMASKPRMPRCMAAKPACNSCRANNSCCDKKPECTCNVMGNENNCSNVCDMARSKGYGCGCNMESTKNYDCACNMERAKSYGCGCNMDWAKKYESSCSKCYDDSYVMPRKYRKCNKGCELTFGEEVDDLPIGMGYVPYQEWDCNVSNACQGLYDGTIFPELVKPFVCTYCYGERSGR